MVILSKVTIELHKQKRKNQQNPSTLPENHATWQHLDGEYFGRMPRASEASLHTHSHTIHHQHAASPATLAQPARRDTCCSQGRSQHQENLADSRSCAPRNQHCRGRVPPARRHSIHQLERAVLFPGQRQKTVRRRGVFTIPDARAQANVAQSGALNMNTRKQ